MSDYSQKLDLIVRLLKEGNGAKEAAQELGQVDDAQKKTKKSAGEMNDSFKDIAKTLAAGLGIQKVTGFLRECTRAFEVQEQAVAKLNGVLRASGQFTEAYSDQLQQIAADLQKVTTIGDEVNLGVISGLVANGAGASEIARLVELVDDLGAGLGNLNQASLLVNKALQGQFQSFREFGFIVDDTLPKGDQLASILDQINQRFGGLARAAANTATGGLTQFKNEIGDTKEEIGKFIAEALTPLLKGLKEAAQFTGQIQAYYDANQKPRSPQEVYKEFDTLLKGITSAQDEGVLDYDAAQRLRQRLTIAYGSGGDPASQTRLRGEVFSILRPDLAKQPAAPPPVGPTAEDKLNATGRREDMQELAAFRQQMAADFGDVYQKLDASFTKGMEQLDALERRGIDVTQDRFDLESAHSLKITELSQKETAGFTAAEQRKLDAARKAAAEIADLRDQLTILSVDGYDRQRVAAQIHYKSAVEEIIRLREEGKLNAEEQQQFSELALRGYDLQIAAIQDLQRAQQESQFWASETGRILQGSAQIFATNFAGAIISAVEGGDKAFQNFVKNTLAGIGQMILQIVIFKAIMGVFGAAKGGMFIGDIDTSFTSMAANGGLFPRMMAAGGMEMTSGPRYMPDFNVLAGEAGRELLTVLARPRMMQIGGMQAAVGEVEGKSMAVVPTSAVAGGGLAIIRLDLSPDVEARIQSNSIRGAKLEITEELGRKTPIRDAVTQAAGVG